MHDRDEPADVLADAHEDERNELPGDELGGGLGNASSEEGASEG
jgi:hypothetical protein